MGPPLPEGLVGHLQPRAEANTTGKGTARDKVPASPHKLPPQSGKPVFRLSREKIISVSLKLLHFVIVA